MFSIEDADPMILQYLKQDCRGESYRLVDPDSARVYDYQAGALIEAEGPCYAIWKRHEKKPCVNCISKRTIKESCSFMKIDVAADQVFLVCAFPITIKERKLSLEMIWNVTDHLVSEDNCIEKNSVLRDLIARINLSVVQDSYTGLYNKSYAEQEIDKKVQNWKQETPLTVVMLDIDNFKEVNDQFGHIKGDLVIKKMAELLLEYAAGRSGTACRVGGDEFLVILRGIPLKTIEFTVEQLKRRISEVDFGEKPFFHITVSSGVAEYSQDMKEWRKLVEEADKLMYLEKNGKRQK